jgi:hypothetical protein
MAMERSMKMLLMESDKERIKELALVCGENGRPET